MRTVTTARLRARKILGRVAGGGDPSLELRKREGGPTLSDAFDLHVSRMRADRASASSIVTITRERDKYLATWMNRPLEKIERSHYRELHEQLCKQNDPYLANRVMRHIRAAWNTALKEHDLPANPTIAVHWNKESRRQEPIPCANLPAWLETVNSIEPIAASPKPEVRQGARVQHPSQLGVRSHPRSSSCRQPRGLRARGRRLGLPDARAQGEGMRDQLTRAASPVPNEVAAVV